MTGIKLGVFGDAGTKTCGGAAASYGNEKLDAVTFASWGVSYLKYANCYPPDQNKCAPSPSLGFPQWQLSEEGASFVSAGSSAI